jgi:hypothetical protein
MKGYIFSVQEQTEEEPIYHYYFIQLEQNKQPTIKKPNNIIDIIHSENLEMIDINEEPDELQTFTTIIESILRKPISPIEKNIFFTNINQDDIQILRRN